MSPGPATDDRPGAYRSRFGGLWTDRTDAEAQARTLLEGRRIDAAEQAALIQFIREGYAILPAAVDERLLAAFEAGIEGVFTGRLLRKMTYWDEEGHHLTLAQKSLMGKNEAKLLDFHGPSPAAHDLIFAPRVRRFLELVFRSEALAFQSLYFQRGSQQGIHQDTAFVPVAGAPLEFVASWIALEDVQPGAGELVYVPRSHRLPDLVFGTGTKKCPPDDPLLPQYTELVRRQYESAGLVPQTFLPRRGDVLIWSADLAHGGAAITRPDATRRSMVTHYCPVHRRPEYATRGRFRVRRVRSGGHVISQT